MCATENIIIGWLRCGGGGGARGSYLAHGLQGAYAQATTDELSGKTLYEPDGIRDSWYPHFHTLYKPADKAHYDSNNKVLVDEILTEDITDTPVKCMVTQVRELCHSLKKNKAAGWDLVTGEHMIYGSDTLYNILALIFNHISASHNVPVHFRKGIIVHIPKAKDKNVLSKDNHRGITLVSVVSKIYEKLLLGWLELNCPLNINRLQGACVYGSYSLNCAYMYILRETVSKLCGDGSTVYVCLLDAKKAFDTVWNKGLFYKLAKLGCNRHLWHILWNYYQGFTCSVQVAGGQSKWFVAEQGVHQGGPFSMKLYTVCNSDLLSDLESGRHGAQLSNTDMRVCCPAYANDIALVAIHMPAMQGLLDIVYQHSSMWRYEFNHKKSHVLVCGRNTSRKQLKIGGQLLEIVSSNKHLGVPLAVDSKSMNNMIDSCVSKGRRGFYASLGLGNKYQPVPPLCLSKLYWSIAIPQMIYGLELVYISGRDENMLESTHSSFARIV